MKTKVVHICGTGSDVGKSVVVAGLCRIFLQDGYKVCPFKSQNMALNSFITKEGGEIGRAQATQAQACCIEPTVDMNPILIKPTSDVGAQIIVRGKPIGNMKALEYIEYKKELVTTIMESYQRLQEEYEVIIMEGAGSPAEINLKEHDIVNMKMAELADSPVILVGDIDKGGVFACLWGTVDLLTEEEKGRVKGMIINKFRGDKSLLGSGLDILEQKTGMKVLGVVPYFKDIRIPEEDSVSLERSERKAGWGDASVNIGVIRLPHISNFTDFDPLENEKDVSLRYITHKEDVADADVIIIPGTKNTISDFTWLAKTGVASEIKKKAGSAVIVGICGGFQMLGNTILDPLHIESDLNEVEGLGFLEMTTTLEKEKTTTQVKAQEISTGIHVTGYEIHHGRTEYSQDLSPVFEIVKSRGKGVSVKDGGKNLSGTIWGTYLHGVFDNDEFRQTFLNKAAKRGEIPAPSQNSTFNQDKEFDKLASLLRENIDMEYIYKIIEKKI
ncbi:cobyric acid synthase [Planctomycetota bacterium]